MQYNNSKGQLTYQIDVDLQKRNGFPIPCTFKSTGKLGVLYPTQALEVTYGDKISDLSSVGVQFNPLAVPIMANMYSKQEHYYATFNSVWQNWDNFISGGEDGTFITPPPTFTMQQLLIKLNSLLNLGLDYRIVTVESVGDVWTKTGTYFYVKLPEKSAILSTLAQNASSFFATYGMQDLYMNFVYKSVVNLEKWFESFRDQVTELRRAGNSLTSHITKDIYQDPITEEYYILIGSTLNGHIHVSTGSTDPDVLADPYVFGADHVDEIFDRLRFSITLYANNIGDTLYSTDDYFLFNSTGYEFLTLMFGAYKPFIGVGSNIDCLNINRLTTDDFIYLYYCSMVKSHFDSSDFVLNTDVISDVPYRILELRIQYLIWYNNYRDQLLETSAMQPRKDDDVTDTELIILTIPRVRCWEKDSYTTALDNPATADAVIPINSHSNGYVTSYMSKVDDNTAYTNGEVSRNMLNVYEIKFLNTGDSIRIPNAYISGLSPHMPADDSNYRVSGSSFSLHVLDAVKRAQKFLRKALFYGNRIQDFIFVNFGVQHLDARLRLPELLATSSDMAEIQTLVNNTTTAESVAGDRAGFAKGGDKGNRFERYCEESGVIMSFYSVIPEPTYAYGTSRQYSRLDRFDYPFPDFATLGLDAVYDSELVGLPTKVFIQGNLTAYPLVFGYQGRYYDKKFRQSTEHGELLTSQDMYTFGRRWNMYNPAGRPFLNAEFVHCFPKTDMFVMADGTEDVFKFDVYHDTIAELQLPYHSVYM